MHFHIADVYQATGSRLHRLDPRLKLVVALTLILMIALTPTGEFGAYVAFFALTMSGALVARLDPGLVMRRSLIALPFAAAAVTLVFTGPDPILGWIPVLHWRISEPRTVRFASAVFKSVISMQVGVLLIFTTPFTDLLWALGALRIPGILVAIISFMYRYLFLLVEEAVRLTRARNARSAIGTADVSLGGSMVFRAKTTGNLIGSLLVRGFERSERVYQAMVARGYRGQIRQLGLPPIRPADVAFAATPVLIGALILLLSLGV